MPTDNTNKVVTKNPKESKLEYLRKDTPENIMKFIEEHSKTIHSKLIVWFARELTRISKEEFKNELPQFINFKKEVIGDLEGTDELVDYKIDRIVPVMEAYKYCEDWYMSVSRITINENSPGYFKSDMSKLTIADAYIRSKQWHDSLKVVDPKNVKQQKLEIPKDDILFEYDDYFIMELKTQKQLTVEGQLMGNCVGSYGTKLGGGCRIFSLREKGSPNQPHVTMEYTNGKLIQIKGKKNETPIPKYQFVVCQWLMNGTDGTGKPVNYNGCTDYLNFADEIEWKGDRYGIKKYKINNIKL